MKCPNCSVSFQPQFKSQLIGLNKKNESVWTLSQLCPQCDQPIVGFKVQKPNESIDLDSAVADWVMLTKLKS